MQVEAEATHLPDRDRGHVERLDRGRAHHRRRPGLPGGADPGHRLRRRCCSDSAARRPPRSSRPTPPRPRPRPASSARSPSDADVAAAEEDAKASRRPRPATARTSEQSRCRPAGGTGSPAGPDRHDRGRFLVVGLGNPGPDMPATGTTSGPWWPTSWRRGSGRSFRPRKGRGPTSSRAGWPGGRRAGQAQVLHERVRRPGRGARRFYKVGVERIIVVHDELDLALRRACGSSAAAARGATTA